MTNDDLRARLALIVPSLVADLRRRRRGGARGAEHPAAWSAMLDILHEVVAQVARRTDNRWIDIEDIVQRVALKLQAEAVLARLAGSNVPLSYLRGLVRYTLLDVARERTPTVPLSELGEERGWTGDSPAEPATDRRLQRMLRSLPADDRRLLQMRFWENRTVADIARELRQPYSRVAVRLFRLIERLKASEADAER